MANEGSSIIEEVENTSTESQEVGTSAFDASAFIDGAEIEKEVEETSEEVIEASTDNDEGSSEEGDDDDGFSWDQIETVKEEEPEEVAPEVVVEDDNWDEVNAETETEVAAADIDWGEIGTEIGIEAATKEELIAKVKEAVKPAVNDNDVITNLKGFLEMTDKDLVIADMRASKYDKDYIEDTIDRLEDSGLMKREATMIRQQLNKHVHSEQDRIRTEEKETKEKETNEAAKSKKDLQQFIKGKEDFFGGKVTTLEKKTLYNYITKGDFAGDIFKSHANVAEAAFLWRNKDKIFKMVRSQGVEQGKSKVLDGITSPNSGNRNSKSFKSPDKGFNPNKFMS